MDILTSETHFPMEKDFIILQCPYRSWHITDTKDLYTGSFKGFLKTPSILPSSQVLRS